MGQLTSAVACERLLCVFVEYAVDLDDPCVQYVGCFEEECVQGFREVEGYIVGEIAAKLGGSGVAVADFELGTEL